MKLSEAFSVLDGLRLSFIAAAVPTIKAILYSPSLIAHPKQISRIIFYNVWSTYGHFTDEVNRTTKESLITPNARGVVLDIGAGLGPTAAYINKDNVARYVAIEPNVLMHSHLKGAANKAGFFEEDGSLLVLSCGAEDYSTIMSALGGWETVDTIISVHTLCSVPNPEQTLTNLVGKILKPGGELLFLEHVASERPDVRFWQWFWTPLWKLLFDGCVIGRPSDVYILNLPFWEPTPVGGRDSEGRLVGLWGQPDKEDNLFGHQFGRFVKHS